MNALKIVQNAGLHCHSRPDECGEQQKYGEKRTKEAHKSSIMLKTDDGQTTYVYGTDGGMYSRVPNRSLSRISIQEGKFSIN